MGIQAKWQCKRDWDGDGEDQPKMESAFEMSKDLNDEAQNGWRGYKRSDGEGGKEMEIVKIFVVDYM